MPGKENKEIALNAFMLVLAFVLMAGIAALLYGYVNTVLSFVYIGLIVTGAASFGIFLESILRNAKSDSRASIRRPPRLKSISLLKPRGK